MKNFVLSKIDLTDKKLSKGHKKLVITKESVDKKGKIDLLTHLEVEDTPALSS